MGYYTYILESQVDKRWYYGFSEDISQRIGDHSANRSKFTRFKGPWTLIFAREFQDKKSALQFERYLKRTRNKAYIKRVYSSFFLNS